MNYNKNTNATKRIFLLIFVGVVILIGVLLNLKATNDHRRLTNSLYCLQSSYLGFKSGLEKEGKKISRDEGTIAAFSDNSPVNLESSNYFSEYSLYDIHGQALDGSQESIRESIAYQRLMGHLDYFTVLEDHGGNAYTTTIAKVFSPEGEFVGIIKLYAPMDSFLKRVRNSIGEGQELYLVDANKTLVSLDNKAFKAGTDGDLSEIIRQTSLIKNLEGYVKISGPECGGDYFYQTRYGLTALGKAA